MKDEYDFSNAQLGKFYKPDLRLIPPVRLEPQVLNFSAKRAEAKGTTLNDLLNTLLKKDIELIEAAQRATQRSQRLKKKPPEPDSFGG